MNRSKEILAEKLPKHVAIIINGNGRWAKQHGKARVFGHRNGVEAVRSVVEGAAEIGVKHLTLYAFSTENWNRPKLEVNALMHLLVNSIHKETKTLNENNIRLLAIGELNSLPEKCQDELKRSMEATKNNTHMDLILALSYSSKWEIVQAVKRMMNDCEKGKLSSEQVTEQMIQNYLTTANVPDPELLIRTSGERRISNFLLWQIAYAELYFTDKLWPDFRKADLEQAIIDFQQRERRFGKTSEQLKPAGK